MKTLQRILALAVLSTTVLPGARADEPHDAIKPVP